MIAETSTGITYTAIPGTIGSTTVTADNTIVNSLTSLSLQLLPAHNLPTNSVIKITLPNELDIVDRATDACTLENLKVLQNALVCAVSSRVITITSPFASTYVPSSTEVISFTINQVTMPSSTAPTGDYVFESFIDEGGSTLYYVDKSTVSDLF